MSLCDNGERCHQAALEYLERGWCPLPLCPPDHVGVGREHGKTCSSPGKAPLVGWKVYQSERPSREEVDAWWRKQPNANVGLAMGPVSGMVGIDSDGPSGETRLLELSGGDLPPTPTFETGKGRRLLYSIPLGVELSSTFDQLAVSEELRFLGKGSQTVAPPSRHATGRQYVWTPGFSPSDLPLAVAPGWLVDIMTGKGGSKRVSDTGPLADGELIPQGRRNAVLTSMAGTMRRRGFSSEAILSALLVENERCDPPLPEHDIGVIARSVSRYDPDSFAGVTIKLGDATSQTETFPFPVPASSLRRVEDQQRWLWRGYLARGTITLLSALWKAGKTTLLAYLLKAMEEDGQFCGVSVAGARILVVTEEHESMWAQRRDEIGLQDHLHFLVRPFKSRPDAKRWQEFMGHLRDVRQQWAYDMLVIDPLSNLWPVRDENDAAQVQNALMPLHSIGDDLTTFLVHHLRKGDGSEATASRGSGALPAFCDTLMELRRFDPANRTDTRRVLTGYGRFAETPDEVVVQWAPQGYTCLGSRAEASSEQLLDLIDMILPVGPPGMTRDIVAERLREDGTAQATGLTTVGHALHLGADHGRWSEEGEGRKGSPHRYYHPCENGQAAHTQAEGF